MACVKDNQVSEKHARINVLRDSIILIDVGSKNGTFLDLELRERIASKVDFPIKENQKFSFGAI